MQISKGLKISTYENGKVYIVMTGSKRMKKVFKNRLATVQGRGEGEEGEEPGSYIRQ